MAAVHELAVECVRLLTVKRKSYCSRLGNDLPASLSFFNGAARIAPTKHTTTFHRFQSHPSFRRCCEHATCARRRLSRDGSLLGERPESANSATRRATLSSADCSSTPHRLYRSKYIGVCLASRISRCVRRSERRYERW